VHPIADLQIEYSLISRGPESHILPVLSELGIGMTAYGVLSRGLLSGSRPKSPGDFRAHLPRFSGQNLESNQHLVETLRRLAAEKGATASQLAIAWVLAKDSRIVPLIGARTRQQLTESLGALKVTLASADVERIESTVPPSAVAGTRYDERQMRVLDSERTGAST
jgi:aryl-alcohol dehydrogenase-like predicted oxidoreductase